MIVSASSRKSSDHTEVDVDLHFAQSPAKVICHSPGRIPAETFRLMSVVYVIIIIIIIKNECHSNIIVDRLQGGSHSKKAAGK